jgi:CheY-like chemotaxis protein
MKPVQRNNHMQQPATVIVIEDHALVREALTYLLRDRGYTILEAEDGRQGLELALKHRPDLVITDLVMPEVDGADLIRELKAHPSMANVPILVLSIHRDFESRRRCLEAGAFAFLDKAAGALEMFASIDEALAHRTPHPS